MAEGCPSTEKLAAYIDGPPDSSLSITERHNITDHLAECETCVQLVVGAVKTLDQISVVLEALDDRSGSQHS